MQNYQIISFLLTETLPFSKEFLKKKNKDTEVSITKTNCYK